MKFKDRKDAGRKLAKLLKEYKKENTVIYAIPRGGVVVAYEVAKSLNAPLDLIITRKIGHPMTPEYAIAAVAESGEVLNEQDEVSDLEREWFLNEVEKEHAEAKRRRNNYLEGKENIPAKGKTAIVVDDGIATGLTIRLAVKELKQQKPEKIIIAVPVILKSISNDLENEIEKVVAISFTSEVGFMGSLSAHYENFPPVEDDEVISILGKRS